MNLSYQDFLDKKRIISQPSGFEFESELNPNLFAFQSAIVKWALKRGKSAIFADCGLGKTLMQLEWARQIITYEDDHSNDIPAVLIVAPLAVAEQTVAEGAKFGYDVVLAESQNDITKPAIYITNYDKLHRFIPTDFVGIILDESSILKGDGPTKKALVEFAQNIPFRLCATATPAPNDVVELCNHAEFLGVLSPKEVMAIFFTQNGNSTKEWRLKNHAKQAFYEWLASWAIAVRKPSDIGFSDEGFNLPAREYFQHTVITEQKIPSLLPNEAKTLSDRKLARKDSLSERVKVAAELVNNSSESWVVWCDLNAESEALTKAIEGAIEVTGSMPNPAKKEALLSFSNGESRVIVSKPQIAGFGLNWQHCHNMIFVGLSDSYEQQYQAIRRCWRFGQNKPVNIHFVTSDKEGAVLRNVKAKAAQMDKLFDELIAVMKDKTMETLGQTIRAEEAYKTADVTGEGWRLMLGDCMERVKEIESESIGLTVTSIPFAGMYAYLNSPRDVGNARNEVELFDHLEYLMGELLRVTIPGRMVAIHIVNEPIFKGAEGYTGIRDSRGELVRRMLDAGFIWWGDITIDKNPQVKAARTKEQSLLFKTLSADSCNSRPCFPDYLVVFKKPGENPAPVTAGTHPRWNPNGGWITSEEWIEWARPIWYAADNAINIGASGIRESDVLNVSAAKDPNDERHLCPLQLKVIERAVKLWSNPGDLILDPFNGVGSTGDQAVRLKRQYIGIEIKESYFNQAVKNLENAESSNLQMSIFDLLGQAEPATI